MAESSIEWTQATWNPIAGCAMVSDGCTNCYAMRMAARLAHMGQGKYADTTRKSGGRDVWTGQVNINEEALAAPLSWKRPRHIFVNSMSDLFQEGVAVDTVKRIWDVMDQTPQHTYQILTKRADRMRDLAPELGALPNVWLGVTVEHAGTVSRLDSLRATPASVRFVSFEPLLGPVPSPDLSGIHWAIVGGESGPNARPMALDWVDELHNACQAQHVAFFFKQWGGRNKKRTGRMLHGQTWDEYPVAACAAE